MAIEQASPVTTESGSLAKWTSWLAGLVGLWVVISPFKLTGSITSGPAKWSNVVAGLLVLVLAAYGAYQLRTSTPRSTAAEWSGWIASLGGLWIVVSPFVLVGPVTSGTPMWSNVVAGIVAAFLAAYAGHGSE